ncbi:hypothetical protein [Flavobacterium sp. ov086]|uniref:hypothetical protein n=1 Tax=Flavobacterium sp. ov086 TaxID=1761785 RepID=UPI000B69A6B7|nr:hypothetical protein [Flavobacterium sp. ov086]SNR32669.1 hypothetical protein SAMN04487979_10328 [Flavobacterium sp. ov086]
MRHLVSALCFFVFLSCKNNKADIDKTDNKDQESSKNKISKKAGDDFKSAPIDFLEEKYKRNGYSLPDYSPTFPTYSFSDKQLGIFSVSYIGKSELIQNYWNVSNLKGFFSQFQDINQASGNSKLINDKVSQILKHKTNDYFIIADFLPKESIKYFDDGSGDFELKKDAHTYFYIYENDKWVFIKKLLTNKIDKEGISLYNDLLLNDKVKLTTPISEKFLGQFEVGTKAN